MEYRVFELTNRNGMKAKVTEFGAILMDLFVPAADGSVKDIVMGFEKPEDYNNNPCFFGASIGRSANRINNAKCIIDGKEYTLAVNDGKNNLHTEMDKGFHKAHWNGTKNDAENSVTFSYLSPEGDCGFPGEVKMKITYRLDDENGLEIHYEGDCSKVTLLNCTNHSYFNLSGDLASSACDHELKLLASHYTPVVAGAIPTGEIADVKGTVFDFTDFRQVGKNIDDDVEQLKLVQGYDHNFAIDHKTGSFDRVAQLKCDRTKIMMDVYTDLPGIQFYAGNCISPQTGKGGVKYDRRQALCLETQFFPDSINQENFEKPLFGPDKKYDTKTVYRFSTY
ncbi:MAG: galactose mutarotase [Lachnospiraceae bacterium]|nr:galactose mutarotase [Lachnospiraceae bacterium]